MINLLRKRRSIRKYQDRKIEAEKVAILKEALLRSPTSRNHRAWQFVVSEDRKLNEQLALARENGPSFVASAPLAIVVLGDENKSDVWIEDCSIAAIVVQLAAESLGLGSCWYQIRNRKHSESETAEEYLQKALDVPANLKVLAMIAIGYPAEEKPGWELDELPDKCIREVKA